MNIIELAKQADKEKYFNIKNKELKTFLERFAALVRAEVPEEAAKVAIKASDNYEGAEIAAKIRGLK